MLRCFCSLVAILGLVFAVIAIIRPAWASDVGLDLWNLPKLNSNLAEQQQIATNLEYHRRIVCKRLAAKQEVLDELLAQRVTLMEAAAAFRHLDNTPPEAPEKGPDYYPGRTEGERYCREVVQWAQCETAEDVAGNRKEIVSRLDDELETYLSRHDGEVILTEK